MKTLAISGLGWMATALIVASYFFSRPIALRGLQLLAALLWLVYGGLIDAPPVVVANALVIAAAGWTMLRARAQVHRPLRDR